MIKKRKTSRRKAPKRAAKKATRRKAPKRAAKKTTRRKASKKTVRKKTAKKRKTSGKRKASGLTKLTYSVSSDLAEVVGSGQKTRPQIVKHLWAYIKKHGCQHKTNRRMIVPDSKLSKVLGKNPIDMLKLAGCISKHIK